MRRDPGVFRPVGFLFPAIGLLLLVLGAAWIPFPKTPGLVEEWSYVYAFDRGQPWIAPDFLSMMPTRPLLPFVYGIAYRLTPGSFAGLQLVHMLVLFGKGVVAALLARRLRPADPAFAALLAALFVVFPADRALLLTRDTGSHFSVLFLLLATLLLFDYAEAPRPLAALGLWGSQALALGTYEHGFLVLFAAPLLLAFVSESRPRSGAHWARLLVVWYAVPLVLGVWTWTVLHGRDSYQARLLQSDSATGAALLLGTLRAIPAALARHFIGGWAEAARGLAHLRPGDLTAAALPAIFAAFALLRTSTPQMGKARSRGLLVAGVVALVLGAIPFLVAPGLRGETRRVYLVSSFGAALFFSAAIVRVRDVPRGRPLAALAASALVLLAVTGARMQRRVVEDTGLRERKILRGIVEAMPNPAAGALVLFLDAEGPPRTEELFGLTKTDVHLADAVRVVYRRFDIPFLVFGRPLAHYWNGRAHAGPEGVTVSFTDGRSMLFPYDRVTAFREDAAGSVSLLTVLPPLLFPFPAAARYAPGPLLGSGAPPARLETLVP
ncbi:MAG: hypothetical protein ACHQPI_04825 [Thermoanaerobaculia bacterium]